MTSSLFLKLLLMASPVCVTVPAQLDEQLGPGWRGLLEKRLGRPLDASEGCAGDRLELTVCERAVCVRLTPGRRERRIALPDTEAAEALTLLIAGLVADPSVARRSGDVTPLPPLVPATPTQPSSSGMNALMSAPPGDAFHLLASAGGGAGFRSGLFVPTVMVSLGFRLNHWSLMLDTVQILTLNQRVDPGMWMGGLVLWYGVGLSRRWRIDGGVGLGVVSTGTPWDGLSFSALALQTRFLVRPTVALLTWLSLQARFEVGLSTALNSTNPAGSHAALLMGLEARF